MIFFPDSAPNSRKEWRLLLFQSNLRKQIRKLPKILKCVRTIHYYSKLFTGVLRCCARRPRAWSSCRPAASRRSARPGGRGTVQRRRSSSPASSGRTSARSSGRPTRCVLVSKNSKNSKFLIFAKIIFFARARSRLYRIQFTDFCK